MNNYYVKWNSKIQKWFDTSVKAYHWCVEISAKFPTKTPYYCFYSNGDLVFTFTESEAQNGT